MRQFCRRLLQGGVVVALAVGAVSACTDFSSPPPSLGHVKVLVVDSATNAGVGSLPMTLFLNDRTTAWRALSTSSDGTGEFGQKDGGVIPATYIVNLDLRGSAYSLADGQTNDKPVQAIIGTTVTVNFRLHKGQVRPPGG